MMTQNLKDVINRLDKLEQAIFGGLAGPVKKKQNPVVQSDELDFSMSSRAFIKRYSKGMSGPKKFTLLLAYLTKGDATKSIKLEEIKKHWSKGLFSGKINSFYSTQAKSNDWIDSRKKEEYSLRPSWKDILSNER